MMQAKAAQLAVLLLVFCLEHNVLVAAQSAGMRVPPRLFRAFVCFSRDCSPSFLPSFLPSLSLLTLQCRLSRCPSRFLFINRASFRLPEIGQATLCHGSSRFKASRKSTTGSRRPRPQAQAVPSAQLASISTRPALQGFSLPLPVRTRRSWCVPKATQGRGGGGVEHRFQTTPDGYLLCFVVFCAHRLLLTLSLSLPLLGVSVLFCIGLNT